MPIYEYQCKACNHELEAIQKISEAPLTVCPACGEPQLAKRVSAAGFRLKGGGWYETDFKSSDKKKNLAGDGKSESTTAPAKTETKTESAPAKTAPAGD
ncbi:MAG: zinc ribbon domain-containing protein [Methylococcaceae bacterium]|nr:zinc ribbon domain-containing protein [Methylococcaceae bacterium]